MTDIHTIDTHYLDGLRFAAVYLLVGGDEAALVDNNSPRGAGAEPGSESLSRENLPRQCGYGLIGGRLV